MPCSCPVRRTSRRCYAAAPYSTACCNRLVLTDRQHTVPGGGGLSVGQGTSKPGAGSPAGLGLPRLMKYAGASGRHKKNVPHPRGGAAACAHRRAGATRGLGATGRSVACAAHGHGAVGRQAGLRAQRGGLARCHGRRLGNLWNQRTRGASTPDHALAGLLDSPDMADLRQRPGGRSVAQNGQTVAAQVLDRRWRKDQILEAYLNLVPFRGELVGIDALSRTLFSKAAARAGRPRGPPWPPPWCAAPMPLQPSSPSAPAVCCTTCRRGSHRPQGGLRRADLFVSAALQSGAAGPPAKAWRRILRGGAGAGRRGGGPPAHHHHHAARPLQRLPCKRWNNTCASCRAARWKTAPLWCSTTPRARCWPGWVRRPAPARRPRSMACWRCASRLHAQALLVRTGNSRAAADRRLTGRGLARPYRHSGGSIPQNYDRQFKGWVSVRTALASLAQCAGGAPWSWSRPMRSFGNWWRWACRCASGATSATAWRWAAARCPAAPGQRLPRPGQWGALQPGGSASARLCGRWCLPAAGAGRPGGVHRGDILSDGNAGRAPSAPTACWPRASGAPSKPAPAGHARQLGRGLVCALHRGRVGGQRQRRSHARRERQQRRGTGLGGRDGLPARTHAQPRPRTAARAGAHRCALWTGPAAPCRWRQRAANGLCPGTQQTLFAIDKVADGAYEMGARGQNTIKMKPPPQQRLEARLRPFPQCTLPRRCRAPLLRWTPIFPAAPAPAVRGGRPCAGHAAALATGRPARRARARTGPGCPGRAAMWMQLTMCAAGCWTRCASRCAAPGG